MDGWEPWRADVALWCLQKSLELAKENHMGLLGISRKNKEKWASIVMPKAKAGAAIMSAFWISFRFCPTGI